ncbi:DNA replication protein [Pullulanibacillus camelliae]|uniref:DNA replication protein n=1 Tax=Pullulanibacillus camelliae TaxID=1707096 RepID=A0A8J2YK74_9BACL|nr:ATP-binding protein [Pullulanibacillus camelliae]GGE47903.1 DNA replication protein [Pullulanibacillus camelliae]
MEAINKTIEQIVSQNEVVLEASPYKCPYCGRVVEPIEVNVFGRKRTVQPKCGCEWREEKKKIDAAADLRQKHETERLFGISNLGKRFEEATLENILPRPGTEKVIKLAHRYVREFKKWGQQSLLVWGSPGNGKTHIASAIANKLHRQGYTVVFQSVPELLGRIKSTFNKSSRDTEAQIMKALLTCDLLILDDIGAEKLSEWVEDVMFRVIDGRYRKELPIMYTSNLEIDQIADRVSDRTFDRIMETSVIVENKATSYRFEQAQKRARMFSGE